MKRLTKMFKDTLGQISLSDLQPIILVLVVGAVILGITSTVQTTLSDDLCTNLTASGKCEPNGVSAQYNTSFNALNSFEEISSLYSLLGLMVASGAVLGALFFLRRIA